MTNHSNGGDPGQSTFEPNPNRNRGDLNSVMQRQATNSFAQWGGDRGTQSNLVDNIVLNDPNDNTLMVPSKSVVDANTISWADTQNTKRSHHMPASVMGGAGNQSSMNGTNPGGNGRHMGHAGDQRLLHAYGTRGNNSRHNNNNNNNNNSSSSNNSRNHGRYHQHKVFNNRREVKVSGETNPKAAAGAIAHQTRAGAPPLGKSFRYSTNYIRTTVYGLTLFIHLYFSSCQWQPFY